MLESTEAVPETRNPFGNAFSPAFESSKTSVVDEASEMVGAALLLKSNAAEAIKQGNKPWLYQIKGNAKELARAAGGFIRQALVIAVAKFVLEICALVINSIMDSLNKRGKPGVEFTTPNVRYAPPGSAQAQPPGQPNRGYDANPFASVFHSNHASVSPF